MLVIWSNFKKENLLNIALPLTRLHWQDSLFSSNVLKSPVSLKGSQHTAVDEQLDPLKPYVENGDADGVSVYFDSISRS